MRVGCQWAMYAEHKKHRHPEPAKHCLAQRTERHGSWIDQTPLPQSTSGSDLLRVTANWECPMTSSWKHFVSTIS